jgi:DNA helicase-2/ATP-dependent DNA helicase PcrA
VLPYELRGDRETMPSFDGSDPKAFGRALRERGFEDERRLCYVALTRAREVLVVSASHWYGDTQDPHMPGRFYNEIASHDACEEIARVDAPAENPLIEARRERVREWPRTARPDDADALFVDGWNAAARDPSRVEQIALSLGAGERAQYEDAVRGYRERIEAIAARTRVSTEPPVPSRVAVTSMIDYLRCPKLFYWSTVRPLPRKPSAAARLGTDVHRWIEVASRGQATLLDVDDLPDLANEERSGEPSSEERLRDAWRASRYASAVPLFTERPFLLWFDGFVIGGRIDAIFGTRDGAWEIVDYKTGRMPDDDDPLSGVQLDVYALAATELWDKKPDDLTLTYFYLDANRVESRPAGDVAMTRERIANALRGIEARAFEPAPGEHCGWCDFLAFCAPGRRWMRSNA